MAYTCHTHVIHMSFTCHTHAIHMSYTCHTHVTNMSYTCLSHVIHMSYMCITHVIHTQYPCHTHVIHMSYSCHTHVIRVSYTCQPHVIHLSHTLNTQCTYRHTGNAQRIHREYTSHPNGLTYTCHTCYIQVTRKLLTCCMQASLEQSMDATHVWFGRLNCCSSTVMSMG